MKALDNLAKCSTSLPDKISQRFFCDICTKFFLTKTAIQKHMENIHLNEIIGKYQDSRRCRYCTKFVVKENYQEHVKQNHKLLKCEICTRVFFNVITFQSHMKTHDPPKYSCDICDQKYSIKGSLKKHILGIHLRKIPRSKCEICGKVVNTSNLQRHIKAIHKKERDYFCDVCHKGFQKPEHLIQHLAAVHLKQKNHVCTICNRKFSAKSDLQVHYNGMHGGKPKIQCEKCERTFALRMNYKRHMKSHEKFPFSCKSVSCRQMFKTEKAVGKHVSKVHTNPKITYCCNECEKIYNSRQGLVSHMETNHRGLRFQCHCCEKEYTAKHLLKHHLLKHHISKI